MFGPLFGSADSGFAFDTKLHACFYTSTCVGGGTPQPNYGGTLGVTGSVGTGALCSGEQYTQGGYWLGGGFLRC